MSKIRILLIEDNRLLREGITATINGQRDMNVVAASAGSDTIVQRARTLRPQILLLDLGLRTRRAVQVVASFTKEVPAVKVIGMGLIPAQSDIVELVQAGASGFILKNATIGDFLRTVRRVARGEKVLPPPLTHSLFTHVIELALTRRKGPVKDSVRMTKREREIIALIADGLSNKEIAHRLGIATYTVKSHVHNILEKLALHSRLQIAVHMRDDAAMLP